MARNCRGSRGQSSLELVVLAAVTVAAFVGMQTYLRRGVQAKLKTSALDLLRSPFGLSAQGTRIRDDGSIEPLGEPTQRRGAIPVDLLATTDFTFTCPNGTKVLNGICCPSGAVVKGGVACTEGQQDRDADETYAARSGAIAKQTAETQTVHSESVQIFEELLGGAPAKPQP